MKPEDFNWNESEQKAQDETIEFLHWLVNSNYQRTETRKNVLEFAEVCRYAADHLETEMKRPDFFEHWECMNHICFSILEAAEALTNLTAEAGAEQEARREVGDNYDE